jgi:hypothetical protein
MKKYWHFTAIEVNLKKAPNGFCTRRFAGVKWGRHDTGTNGFVLMFAGRFVVVILLLSFSPRTGARPERTLLA